MKFIIIFILLFCSFSNTLYPKNSENFGENDSTNYTNKNQTEDSNYNFTDSPFFKIGIIIISLFLGIIIDRKSIRYKEKRDARKEFREVFHSVLVEIKNNNSVFINSVSEIFIKNIIRTDTAFEFLIFSIGNKKGEKIIATYEKYKNNGTNRGKKRFGKNITIYDIDENKMKDGKDLCLHDIQKIIDLAK